MKKYTIILLFAVLLTGPILIQAQADYGSKHQNLLKLREITHDETGVVVPEPHGISTQQIQKFLAGSAPAVLKNWEELGRNFDNYRKAYPDKPPASYLDIPEAKVELEDIDQAIYNAFGQAGASELVYRSLGINDEILTWMRTLESQGSYLMVRSSGAEDTKKLTNAGGNASIAYVLPNPGAVVRAVGEVVRSFFSEHSLRNRLNAGDNPFESQLKMGVTMMELIGEPVGGTSDLTQIPVSLVLFTNEPTYTGAERFRIMRISATYGHGEAVVGNKGIATDTYLILESHLHPGELYIFSDIGNKTERLAPAVNSNGDIKLAKMPNEASIATKPALSGEVLKRLFQLGKDVESAYGGHATDMELVVRGDIIYPVQARPVNRPQPQASYVDPAKLRQAEVNPVDQYIKGHTLVAGLAAAEVIDTPSEIVLTPTIDEAERQFEQGKQRVVFGSYEEPANSHPVVNFSNLGIPVVITDDLPQLEEMIAHIDKRHPLVVDTQSGQIFLWNLDKGEVAPFLTPGYRLHPADPNPQVDTSMELSAYAFMPSAEVKQTVGAAIDAIRESCHGSQPSQAVSNLVLFNELDHWKQELHQLGHVKGSQAALSWLDQVHVALTQAVGEWQTSLSKAAGPLECLFYARVAENTAKLVPSVEPLLLAVQQRAAYEQSFTFTPLLSEEALLASYAWTPQTAANLVKFLRALEESHHATHKPSTVQLQTLQEMMSTFRQLGILPIWYMTVFADAISRLEPQEALSEFLGAYNESTVQSLKELERLRGELSAVSKRLPDFADPASFDSAWQQLQQVLAAFTSDYLKKLKDAPAIVRLGAASVLHQAVSLLDDSIKKMKASAQFDQTRKLELFRTMLSSDLRLLQAYWVLRPQESFLGSVYEAPIPPELSEVISRQFFDARDLLPSDQFDVITFLENYLRSTPRTAEDVFTSIHQLLLRTLQTYLHGSANLALNEATVPALLVHAGEFREKTYATTLVGFDVTYNHLVLRYEVNLRVHSAQLTLTLERGSPELLFAADFYGADHYGRWQIAEQLAFLTQQRYGIASKRPARPLGPDYSQGLTFTWRIKDAAQLQGANEAFEQMVDLTFRVFREDRMAILKSFVERALDNLNDSQREQMLRGIANYSSAAGKPSLFLDFVWSQLPLNPEQKYAVAERYAFAADFWDRILMSKVDRVPIRDPEIRGAASAHFQELVSQAERNRQAIPWRTMSILIPMLDDGGQFALLSQALEQARAKHSDRSDTYGVFDLLTSSSHLVNPLIARVGTMLASADPQQRAQAQKVLSDLKAYNRRNPSWFQKAADQGLASSDPTAAMETFKLLEKNRSVYRKAVLVALASNNPELRIHVLKAVQRYKDLSVPVVAALAALVEQSQQEREEAAPYMKELVETGFHAAHRSLQSPDTANRQIGGQLLRDLLETEAGKAEALRRCSLPPAERYAELNDFCLTHSHE